VTIDRYNVRICNVCVRVVEYESFLFFLSASLFVSVCTFSCSCLCLGLVSLTVAKLDLDNLRLQDIPHSTLHVEYKLDYLLISGHCIDTVKNEHPAGLQLVLGTNRQPSTGDTVVMQNLGYFQLKANPGVWTLRMKSKHSAIYEIESDSKSALRRYSPTKRAAVLSFADPPLRLRVKRRAGQERTELLEAAPKPRSAIDRDASFN
jgi:hypothetical protein